MFLHVNWRHYENIIYIYIYTHIYIYMYMRSFAILYSGDWQFLAEFGTLYQFHLQGLNSLPGLLDP